MQLYSLARESESVCAPVVARVCKCTCLDVRESVLEFCVACLPERECVCVYVPECEREKERDDVMFLKQSGSIGSQMFSSSQVCPIFKKLRISEFLQKGGNK